VAQRFDGLTLLGGDHLHSIGDSGSRRGDFAHRFSVMESRDHDQVEALGFSFLGQRIVRWRPDAAAACVAWNLLEQSESPPSRPSFPRMVAPAIPF